MSNKRTLITGQRHGSLLVLMEIEKKQAHGGFDVIVFCYACKKAKRLQKSRFAGTQIAQSCGCVSRKRFGQSMFGHAPIVRTKVKRPYDNQRQPKGHDWRYGRSLRRIQ